MNRMTVPTNRRFSVPTSQRSVINKPWTPSAIATSAWYDASDESTIIESGGDVSQWSDKSGNERHVTQSTSTLQPRSGVSTLNNRNTLDFDGIDDHLSIANDPWHNNGNLNVFSVAHHRSPGSTDMIIANNTQGNDGWFNRIQGDDRFRANMEDDGTSATIDPIDAYTAQIFEARFSTPEVGARINGGTEVTNSGTGYNPTMNPLVVGAGGIATLNAFNGEIAEIIIVSGVLNTKERQKIEGYLAWKWGLVSSLDAGHPYKSSPPTA